MDGEEELNNRLGTDAAPLSSPRGKEMPQGTGGIHSAQDQSGPSMPRHTADGAKAASEITWPLHAFAHVLLKINK